MLNPSAVSTVTRSGPSAASELAMMDWPPCEIGVALLAQATGTTAALVPYANVVW
jgi:hypothetical protein